MGRDVWLPKPIYDAAICNTRSRQMIVKNIVVAVFGIKVLQNSSITGTKCNKFRDLKPKPKLDERKILAIEGMNIEKNVIFKFQILCLI